MRFVFTITAFCLLASCSSLKKTLAYSSLSGGMAGATAGAALSPTKKDRGANAFVFGLVGAGLASLAGYALYQDDPRNYKLRSMLIDPKEGDNPNAMEIGLGPLKLNIRPKREEIYQVLAKDLPDKLKGKVGKQYLIKYHAKERYIKQGPKTYYIPAFEVYEYSFHPPSEKRGYYKGDSSIEEIRSKYGSQRIGPQVRQALS